MVIYAHSGGVCLLNLVVPWNLVAGVGVGPTISGVWTRYATDAPSRNLEIDVQPTNETISDVIAPWRSTLPYDSSYSVAGVPEHLWYVPVICWLNFEIEKPFALDPRFPSSGFLQGLTCERMPSHEWESKSFLHKTKLSKSVRDVSCLTSRWTFSHIHLRL